MIGKRSSIWIAMKSRGIRGKWKAMWHSSASPKYSAASSGHWFASASSIRLGKRSSTCRRRSFRKRVRLGEVLADGAGALVEVRHGVQAQAVDADPEPVVDHREQRPPDVGAVEVQVRLVRVEAVPVVLLRHRVPGPVRRLEVGEDDPRVAVAVGGVAPDVEVAPAAAGRRAAGALEPGVLVGGVVQHQLGDHAQAAVVRAADELGDVAHRPVGRVDRAVVGDVVAVVAERRGVERQQPDRRDAEVLEVVQLRDQALEVADPVAAEVAERADVQLVDDRVAVPVRGVVQALGGIA